MKPKSIVIINTNSELNSLFLLIDYQPSLLDENILIIDRRQNRLNKSNISINRNIKHLNLNVYITG